MRGKRIAAVVMTFFFCLSYLSGSKVVVEASEKETSAASNINEPENHSRSEIVFLLDTSVSMNKQDKDREAIDAIRQAAYSVPSQYKTGMIAYNTDIQAAVPLSYDPGQMEETLQSIEYTGYTNAGNGLSEAVTLFSDDEGIKRYIVMFSDGEIDMPGSGEKEASRLQYVEAARLAKEKGIKIYILAIGTEIGAGMHIFDGAELTDGAIYWEGLNGSIAQITEQILTDRLGVTRTSAGVTDAGGGSIHIDIPANVDRMKLLLTTNGTIKQATADYTAQSGQTISGSHFAVVDMLRPTEGSADLLFQTDDISNANNSQNVNVKAYLVTEYKTALELGAAYRIEEQPRTEEEIRKDIPVKYDHFADITLRLMDMGGSGENIWISEAWEGREIPYTLNGISYVGTIKQGTIKTTLEADGIETLEATISLNALEAGETVFSVAQPMAITLETFPDPVPAKETDYRPLWAVLILLVAAALLLLIWWIKRRNTTIIYMAQSPKDHSMREEKKVETRNCAYMGKFNLYVVKTKDDRDVPPQTYMLFGRTNGRMDLNKILTACGIRFGKIGAEDIIFYPGPDSSIIIMDQSERCTVMRGSEILKKGMGYPAFFGEKLTVTFEDEMTEMEIHYKNLKPSEKETVRIQ